MILKIKSNLEFNTSLLARHTAKDKNATKVVIGGSLPEYLLIPAGSTIELEDLEWKKFAGAAKPLLASGNLTLVEAPKLSEEAQVELDAEQLAEAQAVVAKLSKPTKTAKAKAAASAEPATGAS